MNNLILFVFIALILLYMICRLVYLKIYYKKVVVIQTSGGLGNQIFQICFGYSISKRNNCKLLILKSCKTNHKNNNHEYYTNIFKHFKKLKPSSNYNYLLHFLFGNSYYEPSDKFTSFKSELMVVDSSTKFNGYFQNEKFFIDYKDELIKMLTDNCVYKKILQKHNKMDSYFLHIRRGDYVNNKSHYVDLDVYYRNAIRYILNIDPYAHFYILSDDIEYCKSYQIIKDINKTFYENSDELETMYFISLCSKGGICGNSSFAWFGSYLNTNPKKKVIFPDKWFSNKVFYNDIYYKNSIVLPAIQTPMTVVSGYWIVDSKHSDSYIKWFANTLSINCPYVFFGDKKTIEIIKEYRKNFPTYYVECEIKDFYTYKYFDRFIVDKTHCPSKELSCIWNEKIFLVQKAKNINPFKSDFFVWIDAGICSYRYKKPPLEYFPNPKKVKDLPTNKFIFTSSDNNYFEPDKIGSFNYHYISGTSFCLNIKIVDEICQLYKICLDLHVPKKDNLYTDKVIYTLIYKDKPKLFYKIGNGYGKMIEMLY
jgi:hypothetical protein